MNHDSEYMNDDDAPSSFVVTYVPVPDDGVTLPWERKSSPAGGAYVSPAPRGKVRMDEITNALVSGTAVPASPAVIDPLVNVILDPTTRGESVTYTTAAPSWFVSTVSDRKVNRTKRGQSVKVTRRGRAVVVGDVSANDYGHIPSSVVMHSLDDTRRGSGFGHAGAIDVAKLTERLYGDSIPALIGSEHESWSEVLPERVSAAVSAYARQHCGISGGMSPLLDMATEPEYKTRDDDPRWFPTRRASAPALTSWSSRHRLTTLRHRGTDPTPRENVILAGINGRGTSWFKVTECTAATADDAYMFVGHRRLLRGTAATRAAYVPVSVSDAFVIDATTDLADALASLAAVVRDDGKARYSWRVADTDHRGTLSVDKRGRVSVVGAGYEIRQAATLDALRKRLAIV